MARLIVDSVDSGIWNMSVDEALLASAASDSFPTTLRFYQWDKATLSLGYFQQLGDRAQHSASGPCCLVRRTTGGGAILHHHELTYSLTTSVKNRLSRAAEDFYFLVHEALLATLAKRNIHCHLHEPGGSPSVSSQPFLCFERRSPGDILLGQTKIAGSAQRRHKGCLLQHGSLLLATSTYAPELIGLETLAGARMMPNDLVADWTFEIEKSLGTSFESGQLTNEEIGGAKSFVRAKFGLEKWTARR